MSTVKDKVAELHQKGVKPAQLVRSFTGKDRVEAARELGALIYLKETRYVDTRMPTPEELEDRDALDEIPNERDIKAAMIGIADMLRRKYPEQKVFVLKYGYNREFHTHFTLCVSHFPAIRDVLQVKGWSVTESLGGVRALPTGLVIRPAYMFPDVSEEGQTAMPEEAPPKEAPPSYVTWIRVGLEGFPASTVWFDRKAQVMKMVDAWALSRGPGTHEVPLAIKVMTPEEAKEILDAESWWED